MTSQNKAKTTKAVGYYRSSGEGINEDSVLMQRKRVHQFARQNDLEIIHEEEDKRSV